MSSLPMPAYRSLGIASAPGAVGLLDYQSVPEVADNYLPRTLAGFAAGSILMGVALNFAAVFILQHFEHAGRQIFEFVLRGVFLGGMAFVGSSLVLVSLKFREDHSPVPLHSRHPLVALGSGAAYALCVFGPGLAAEHAFPVNPCAAAAVWMLVLGFPLLACGWMVSRRVPPTEGRAIGNSE